MDYLEKLRSMEEQIIDALYIAMVILFLPMVYNISKRVAVVGLDFSSIVTFVLMTLVILFYLFKRGISLRIRTGYIVIAFFINGVSVMISFGLVGLGLLNFVQSVIIASLFIDRKYYILDFILTIFTALVFMFLYLGGTLTYSFDVNDFVNSSNAWIFQIIGFVAALGLNSVPVHVMTNILKKTTKDVVTNEAKYKTLVEATGTLVFSFSRDGYILSLNTAFEKIFREDVYNFIGRPVEDFILGEENKSVFFENLDLLFKYKKSQVFNMKVNDREGSLRFLNVTITPVLEGDELVMVLGTSMDITELRVVEEKLQVLLENENQRLESEIKKRTKELEETYNELIKQEKMASLGRLVAGVAHEINTPLGVSVTAVTYLQDLNNETFDDMQSGGFTKQKLIDYMKHIEESTEIIKTNLERSSELVKNFKKISVNQAGEFTSKFNIREYLEDVFMTLRHEYKHKNIDISIESDEEVIIKSYPGFFSQIFTNLLMNSLIHGFEGRDEGKVRIVISKDDKWILIEYTDNGRGISEEEANMIFEPFYTTKRNSGGSGLGMHIVYNIVTINLGGEIKLGDSGEGGVSFDIRLPMEGA